MSILVGNTLTHQMQRFSAYHWNFETDVTDEVGIHNIWGRSFPALCPHFSNLTTLEPNIWNLLSQILEKPL